MCQSPMRGPAALMVRSSPQPPSLAAVPPAEPAPVSPASQLADAAVDETAAQSLASSALCPQPSSMASDGAADATVPSSAEAVITPDRDAAVAQDSLTSGCSSVAEADAPVADSSQPGLQLAYHSPSLPAPLLSHQPGTAAAASDRMDAVPAASQAVTTYSSLPCEPHNLTGGEAPSRYQQSATSPLASSTSVPAPTQPGATAMPAVVILPALTPETASEPQPHSRPGSTEVTDAALKHATEAEQRQQGLLGAADGASTVTADRHPAQPAFRQNSAPALQQPAFPLQDVKVRHVHGHQNSTCNHCLSASSSKTLRKP